MVKYILSIDFDYIMFPCINLYNDMSAGEENPTVIWENIERARGIDDKFLSYDPKTYNAIVKLVKLAKERSKDVKLIPIDNHQDLVTELKKKEDYNDSTYNIINVDFHHDLLYRPGDRTKIVNFDKYNCSNWAGYLMIKDKIDHYTWVKAPNSALYDHGLDGKYDIKFAIESNRYLDNPKAIISDYPFDEIYLCFSPQWVPYKYRHLYDLIVELFGESSTREEV